MSVETGALKNRKNKHPVDQTGRQDVYLTQWDYELEFNRMQQLNGTQMTSAVLGNRELSSCLVFWPTIPLIIVSSQRGEWLREAQRQRECMSEAKREFARRADGLEPAFVFFRGRSDSPGRVWRTALCLPVYYVIPITQRKLRCSAPHLFSHSEGAKYIFTFCIQTWVCYSPHVWRRNENHQNKIE